MKKIVCLLVMMFVLILTGCGSKEESKNKNEEKYSGLPDVIETCPDCVYNYSKEYVKFSPNRKSTLSTSDYKINWKDVVKESGHNNFLGFKLNSSDEVVKAYVCGIKDNIPFCLEGSLDDMNGGNESDRIEIYNHNIEVFKSICNSSDDCYVGDRYALINGDISIHFDIDGSVSITEDSSICSVTNGGAGKCY